MLKPPKDRAFRKELSNAQEATAVEKRWSLGAVNPAPTGELVNQGVCKIKLQPLTVEYFVNGVTGPMGLVMMLDSSCTQSLMLKCVYQNIYSAFRFRIRPTRDLRILADGS